MPPVSIEKDEMFANKGFVRANVAAWALRVTVAALPRFLKRFEVETFNYAGLRLVNWNDLLKCAKKESPEGKFLSMFDFPDNASEVLKAYHEDSKNIANNS